MNTSPRLAWLVLGACTAEGMTDGTTATDSEVRYCATGPTVQGVDVSAYNQMVDWPAAKAGGVEFAFIRGPRWNPREGVIRQDDFFDRNWAGTREAGILRGAYSYLTTSLTDAQVTELAELFARLVVSQMTADDLPPVVDVEKNEGVPQAPLAPTPQLTPPASNAMATGQSAERIVKISMRFIEIVDGALAAAGLPQRTILYTGVNFWNEHVSTPDLPVDPNDMASIEVRADYERGLATLQALPLWVPNYNVPCPLLPRGFAKWTFWQRTELGRLPGFNFNGRNVDINLFNGTLDELRALAAGAGDVSPHSCIPACEGAVMVGSDCARTDCALVEGETCVPSVQGPSCGPRTEDMICQAAFGGLYAARACTGSMQCCGGAMVSRMGNTTGGPCGECVCTGSNTSYGCGVPGAPTPPVATCWSERGAEFQQSECAAGAGTNTLQCCNGWLRTRGGGHTCGECTCTDTTVGGEAGCDPGAPGPTPTPAPTPPVSWAGLREMGTIARDSERRFGASALGAGSYEVVLTSATGDADLIVTVGRDATRADPSPTCTSRRSAGQEDRCTVDVPDGGSLGVLVVGYAETSEFSLAASAR